MVPRTKWKCRLSGSESTKSREWQWSFKPITGPSEHNCAIHCLHTVKPAISGPSKPPLATLLTQWEIPRDLKPRRVQWTVSLKSLNVLERCSRGGMEAERPASGVSLSSEKGVAWNTFLSDPISFLFLLATVHSMWDLSSATGGIEPAPLQCKHGSSQWLRFCDSTVGTWVPTWLGN